MTDTDRSMSLISRSLVNPVDPLGSPLPLDPLLHPAGPHLLSLIPLLVGNMKVQGDLLNQKHSDQEYQRGWLSA